jgi:putative membrane protein
MRGWLATPAAVAAAFTLPSLAWAQVGERYGGPGMMWDGGMFHMFFGFLMMLLFLGVLVAAVVLLVRWLNTSGQHLLGPGPEARRPLDILKERLARGEIDVDEYEQRKRALGE